MYGRKRRRRTAALGNFLGSLSLRRILARGKFVLVLAVIALGTVSSVADLVLSPWPLAVTIKHYRARRNCDAARAVGLAPARRGAPGYWEHLDADEDGISCEPWGRNRRY
ncbi:Excalibur calcium-binding domain-containing protein [Roseomonas rosea]|uniref:Excalibur calcium-binding domain-containing protein n=2 Tax=Muricoccus roseus TaxID=198092 RepID=A0A1M6AMV7_9PROT|nr:Excalibur calcium-binding domain-containing protein [Roseomonas rosea]